MESQSEKIFSVRPAFLTIPVIKLGDMKTYLTFEQRTVLGRSSLVKDWAYVMNIELHYLPPYSPNLNPIERRWKVMNEAVINSRYFNRCSGEKYGDFFSEILPDIAEALLFRISDTFQVLKPVPSSKNPYRCQ